MTFDVQLLSVLDILYLDKLDDLMLRAMDKLIEGIRPYLPSQSNDASSQVALNESSLLQALHRMMHSNWTPLLTKAMVDAVCCVIMDASLPELLLGYQRVSSEGLSSTSSLKASIKKLLLGAMSSLLGSASIHRGMQLIEDGIYYGTLSINTSATSNENSIDSTLKVLSDKLSNVPFISSLTILPAMMQSAAKATRTISSLLKRIANRLLKWYPILCTVLEHYLYGNILCHALRITTLTNSHHPFLPIRMKSLGSMGRPLIMRCSISMLILFLHSQQDRSNTRHKVDGQLGTKLSDIPFPWFLEPGQTTKKGMADSGMHEKKDKREQVRGKCPQCMAGHAESVGKKLAAMPCGHIYCMECAIEREGVCVMSCCSGNKRAAIQSIRQLFL